MRVLRRAPSAAAFLAAGVVLLADGLVTTVWQEPVSALAGARSQASLRDELEVLERRWTAMPRLTVAPSPSADRVLAEDFAATLRPGRPVGRLLIPRLGLDAVVVHGVGDGQLRRGPAHYPGTGLPGQGTTVGIAAHRSTYGAPLRDAHRLAPGDVVELRLPYGGHRYRVVGLRLLGPREAGVLRRRSAGERLVLTTCDPPGSDARRLVVVAEPEGSAAAS